jgi:RNA polymerase sigma-70 factor (ECF subfamily)
MIERKRLEQLFRQYYGKMVHLARTLLRDDAEADDVVQDVFARLLEGDFHVTDDKMKAYLMSSVRYGCIKRIKALQMRERVRSLYRTDNIEEVPTDDALPELEQIRDYVAQYLTEPHKSVFNMRIDEGLTFREIAERLQININTVYKYFIQCLEQIKDQFTKN